MRRAARHRQRQTAGHHRMQQTQIFAPNHARTRTTIDLGRFRHTEAAEKA